MRKSLHRPEHTTLATLLREFRLGRGMTQVEVCRTLRAPQSFLSDVETGQRRLDLVQLHDLCKALGVSLASLVAAFEKNIPQVPSRRARR